MVKRVRRFPVGDRAVENWPQLIVGANLYVKVSTRRFDAVISDAISLSWFDSVTVIAA